MAVLDISYCLQIFIFGGRDSQQKLTSSNMELKVLLIQGGRCWERETDRSCWCFTASHPLYKSPETPRASCDADWSNCGKNVFMTSHLENQEHRVTWTDLTVGWPWTMWQLLGSCDSGTKCLWEHTTAQGVKVKPAWLSVCGTPTPPCSVIDTGLPSAVFCPLCFSTNVSSLCAFTALLFGYSGYFFCQLSSILLNFFLTT